MIRLSENDIGLLVKMIIHDLEKPVTVNERILSRIANGTLNPGRESHLRLIRTASQASARMRRMLCDLKEVMSGNQPLCRMDFFSLKGLVEAATHEFMAMAETEGVNFEWLCFDDSTVCSDHDLLQRIIENYLHNALSHTKKGDRIWLEAVPKGENGFLIAVGNIGRSIPDEHMDTIFQAGVQLHLREERKWSGSGLGLAFCRMAAESIDGRVWAENLADCGGVVFYLECNPKQES